MLQGYTIPLVQIPIWLQFNSNLLSVCPLRKYSTIAINHLGSDPEEAKAVVYMGLHKLHNLETVKKVYSDKPSDLTKKSTDRIQLIHQVKLGEMTLTWRRVLRLPYRNDAKIAKICHLWTLWLVIQLMNHLFKIRQKAFLPNAP